MLITKMNKSMSGPESVEEKNMLLIQLLLIFGLRIFISSIVVTLLWPMVIPKITKSKNIVKNPPIKIIMGLMIMLNFLIF